MDRLRCGTCGKVCKNEFEFIDHQRRSCKNKTCSNCKTVFRERRDLIKHENNKKNIVCTHCDRIFCNDDHFQKHQRSIKQPTNTTHNLDLPVNPPTIYEEYVGFRELLVEKERAIQDSRTISKYTTKYNRRIDTSLTYRDLENILCNIYKEQKHAYKMNIAFAFILYNHRDDEFRYYYTSSNNLLFEHAMTITNQSALDKFLNKVMDQDLQTNAYLKKPSSGWVFAGLTNMEIITTILKDTPIGEPPTQIPEYLKNSKAINILTNDKAHSYRFKDDKCFFRCLALHEGAKTSALERTTSRLKRELEQHTKTSFDKGVIIDDLPIIEMFFDVAINVYCLDEDGNADIIYLSRLSFKPMHLNLYENHFMYINNFKTFAKRFQCQMCDRVFDQACHLTRHSETCCTEKEEIYLGGKYRKDRTIFERLELEEFEIPDEDRYFPFFSCFDYEAIQKPRHEKIKGREILFKHEPATFSICSNIPGHTEVVHEISDGDPQRLVDKMVEIQLKQQTTSSSLMREKFSYIIDPLNSEIEQLTESIQEYKELRRRDEEPCDDEIIDTKRYKKVKTLLRTLEKYCDELIILGYNSQKYDIPLIRRYLPSSLERYDVLPNRVIKKNNAYMQIATGRLNYLDLTNFLAAGTSLDEFYKAFQVQTTKGIFPYEFFSSLNTLNVPYLPTREKFYSTLRDKHISDKDYDECLKVWDEMPVEGEEPVFGDYVRYYNNNDVIGMVEAIEKMLPLYTNRKLDIFKNAISLPGISQRYLLNVLPKSIYFTRFSKEHSHIYQDLKQFGVVGGPSIIFHRKQIAGQTRIKGKDLCKKIIGYDANSLYLNCTAQAMPCGFYVLREKQNNFKAQTHQSKEALVWLNYLIKNGVNIQHAENHPLGEMRIGDYRVDGYDESTKTVYEYNGCWTHGHQCNNKFDPEKWEKTIQRENHLRRMGYTVISITSCEWMKNPASKDYYETDDVECTEQDIIDSIMGGLSGFIKCSIFVKPEREKYHTEFPPIFKNSEIKLADVGAHMQEHCQKIGRTTGVKRSLISSMFGDDIVIHTCLFKKYMEMELEVKNIEWFLEYDSKTCFKNLQDEVIHDRRLADLDPVFKIKGETSKLIGNSLYGGTLMDKAKHTSLKFVSDERVPNHIKNPLFKNMDVLNGGVHEVEKTKRKVVLDTPIQIGAAVYSYAKLSLLNFWEFINKFLINDLYQLLQMDTDSLYIAFARDTIDDCVKPNLRKQWEIEKLNFFTSTDKTPVEFEGRMIPFSQWDYRTPGKYKPEFEGHRMYCLNSKVYHVMRINPDGTISTKVSCKGTGKRRNILDEKYFDDVLETKIPHTVKNAGFINDGADKKTYTQTKIGLSYFYPKRIVLEDGVSTTHLDI